MDFKFNQADIVSNSGTELHLLIFPSVSLSDRNMGRIASNLINALRPIQLYCFLKGKLGKLKRKKKELLWECCQYMQIEFKEKASFLHSSCRGFFAFVQNRLASHFCTPGKEAFATNDVCK